MGRPKKIRPPVEPGPGSASAQFSEHSDPLDVEIGARLRALRESRGFTTVGLALALGLNPETLRRIEFGHFSLRPERMVLICKKMGVTPDWFFQGLLGENPKLAPTDAYHLLEPRAIFLLRKFSYLSNAQQKILIALSNDLLLARESVEESAEKKKHIRWAREIEE